jgi:putative oxidoreductase
MDARRHEWLTSLGLLVLRLGMGGYMLTHGWTKVEWIMAGDFDNFANPIGLGKPLSLVLAAVAEFLGSILVMVGLGTRIAAAAIAFTMAVAAFLVHGSDAWTLGQGLPSKQPALTFLIAMLALTLTGAGQLSLDAKIWGRRGGGH